MLLHTIVKEICGLQANRGWHAKRARCTHAEAKVMSPLVGMEALYPSAEASAYVSLFYFF